MRVPSNIVQPSSGGGGGLAGSLANIFGARQAMQARMALATHQANLNIHVAAATQAAKAAGTIATAEGLGNAQIKYYRKALRQYGPNHPDVVSGKLNVKTGMPTRAEDYVNHDLAMQIKNAGYVKDMFSGHFNPTAGQKIAEQNAENKKAETRKAAFHQEWNQKKSDLDKEWEWASEKNLNQKAPIGQTWDTDTGKTTDPRTGEVTDKPFAGKTNLFSPEEISEHRASREAAYNTFTNSRNAAFMKEFGE